MINCSLCIIYFINIKINVIYMLCIVRKFNNYYIEKYGKFKFLSRCSRVIHTTAKIMFNCFSMS